MKQAVINVFFVILQSEVSFLANASYFVISTNAILLLLYTNFSIILWASAFISPAESKGNGLDSVKRLLLQFFIVNPILKFFQKNIIKKDKTPVILYIYNLKPFS